MKHVNIPVFVPHLGCPHDCVFCNQRKITGQEEFSLDNVRKDIETVLETLDPRSETAEIAFFGGSFTGIERSLMIELLSIANEFCLSGRVSGIRLSTRPDYIDGEILSILAKYPVKTVELGIQSISDEVLAASRRGHTAEQAKKAMRDVVDAGFELIGQMMIGLPFSDPDSEIETVREICRAGASGIRIYPTAVFSGTALHEMMRKGDYPPLTLEDAVERSAAVFEVAHSHGVKVIRIGLCETASLHSENGIVAGAFHPALGEMCISAFFLKLICKELDTLGDLSGAKIEISVAGNMLSKAIGQKKINYRKIMTKYSLSELRFTKDDRLSEYELKISKS
ncbi:MAG: radical SAM protein [Ruminococcaceae bacterium]|nr:radical SAM protein [Oscillospiraceae bacterium]